MRDSLAGRLFALLVVPALLFGADFIMATGKNEGRPYGVLTITDSSPFNCTRTADDRYLCVFNRKPFAKPRRLADDTFEVIPATYQGRAAVTIIVKVKEHRPFCLAIDPKADESKSLNLHRCAGRWQLLASRNRLPFLSQRPNSGLRFPVAVPDKSRFTVGALDITGNPIVDDNAARESRFYFEAKHYADAGEWEHTIAIVDKAIAKYPSTLFASELLLLKARALSKMPGLDNVKKLIETALLWMKHHVSDEYYPEILLLTADAYAAQGDKKESRYYYNRIRTDYSDSRYTPLSKIHEGDFMVQTSTPQKAYTLYAEALAEAKDLDTASLAALRLAERNALAKQHEQAIGLYHKIFKGDAPFFKTIPDQSFRIAAYLDDHNQSELALNILKLFDQNLSKENPLYEEHLFRKPLELAKLGRKPEAKEGFETYLKAFPLGKYTKEAKSWLARLFLDVGETNETKRTAGLDEIIKTYPSSEMAQQALMEKARLMAAKKSWRKLLELKDALIKLPPAYASERAQLLETAARAEATQALSRGECRTGLSLIAQYALKFDASYDVTLFDCYNRTGQKPMAEKLARSHLHDKPMAKRLEWMYRLSGLLFEAQRHKDASNLARDIINLTAAYKDELPRERQMLYFELLYKLFTSAQTIGNEELMIKTAALAERAFPSRTENLPLYRALAALGSKRRDALMLESWVKKILELQQKKRVRTESPWAEFTYAQIISDKTRYGEAATLIRSILPLPLSPEERSRALYQLALYEKEAGNTAAAKKALQECVSKKGKSSWDRLCADSLKLF